MKNNANSPFTTYVTISARKRHQFQAKLELGIQVAKLDIIVSFPRGSNLHQTVLGDLQHPVEELRVGLNHGMEVLPAQGVQLAGIDGHDARHAFGALHHQGNLAEI